MDPLPVEIYSAAAVRAMDRHAIEQAGIAGYTLMQRAGAAALAVLRRHWPGASRVAVLCGAGNNAGDGYVLARLARDAGLEVRVFAIGESARLAGDAARAFADFASAGGEAAAFGAESLAGVDVVVDALLGTGVDRPVTGAFRGAIEAVNASGLPVLALDIPSGLDADTGLPQGVAVRATRTITFLSLKSGLFLGEAPEHTGALDFDGLDVSAETREQFTPVLRRTTEALLAEALPPRRPASHKGDHGRVLIVGGFAMPGAAALAGEAALRTGAGLVTVATGAGSRDAVVGARPELIVHAIAAPSQMAALRAAASATAIGPGLGLDEAAKQAMDAALAGDRPCVIDADALTLLARTPRRRDDWILTPHPGEAARLLGTDSATVQRDRPAAARAAAERYGGVCVLKGAGTLIQAPGEIPWICDRGGPAMATAGSGDVLTGIIAALLAGGREPGLAAAAGVLLHALAGERAARGGTRGMIAGDLIVELRVLAGSPWS